MEEQSRFDERLTRLWIRAAKEGKQKKWIAEQLRVPERRVRNRADTLRRSYGVKLPRLLAGTLTNRGVPMEVDRLNRLIEGGQSGE